MIKLYNSICAKIAHYYKTYKENRYKKWLDRVVTPTLYKRFFRPPQEERTKVFNWRFGPSSKVYEEYFPDSLDIDVEIDISQFTSPKPTPENTANNIYRKHLGYNYGNWPEMVYSFRLKTLNGEPIRLNNSPTYFETNEDFKPKND